MSRLSHQDQLAFLLLNRLGRRLKYRVLEWLEQDRRPADILTELLEIGSDKETRLCRQFDAHSELEECERRGIRIITFSDPDYPSSLREISDPPVLLYCCGDLLPTDKAALSVVGSRHPSFYGIAQTSRFSEELSRSGMTIVSGFARGIDQTAHTAALRVPGGRTLAVLGCGLNVSYPKGSENLFDQIRSRGAMISEFPLNTPPLSENFPKRNRIISGLSLGVLVTEAHLRSGSLITAHEAAEQGKDVFALPGPVDQLTSRGTHRLIKEGAFLVEDPKDIVEHLSLELKSFVADFRHQYREGSEESEGSERAPVLFPQEQAGAEQTLLARLGQRSMTLEELSDISGLLPENAATLLLRMELSRKIRKQPGGLYQAAGVRSS